MAFLLFGPISFGSVLSFLSPVYLYIERRNQNGVYIMALSWDITEVKDYKTVTTHPTDSNKWHPVTESLVWASLAVGINHITEKNVHDFYVRVNMYEKLFGAYLWNVEKGSHQLFTLEDIQSHIGMRTNISNKTKSQFLQSLFNGVRFEIGVSKYV